MDTESPPLAKDEDGVPTSGELGLDLVNWGPSSGDNRELFLALRALDIGIGAVLAVTDDFTVISVGDVPAQAYSITKCGISQSRHFDLTRWTVRITSNSF